MLSTARKILQNQSRIIIHQRRSRQMWTSSAVREEEYLNSQKKKLRHLFKTLQAEELHIKEKIRYVDTQLKELDKLAKKKFLEELLNGRPIGCAAANKDEYIKSQNIRLRHIFKCLQEEEKQIKSRLQRVQKQIDLLDSKTKKLPFYEPRQ